MIIELTVKIRKREAYKRNARKKRREWINEGVLERPWPCSTFEFLEYPEILTADYITQLFKYSRQTAHMILTQVKVEP